MIIALCIVGYLFAALTMLYLIYRHYPCRRPEGVDIFMSMIWPITASVFLVAMIIENFEPLLEKFRQFSLNWPWPKK